MVRIFSHYVHKKFMLLAGLEALVLLFSFYLGLAFNLSGSAFADSGALTLVGSGASAMTAALFVLGMVTVMKVLGLYDVVLWQNMRLVQVRMAIALPCSLALIFLIVYAVPALHFGTNGLIITVSTAFGGIALVRLLFYKWDKVGAFKPRVLVLGTGSRAVRLADIAQHSDKHFMVGYVPFPPSASHQVPALQVLSIAAGESLHSIVKKHRVNQIVIAVRDRRGALPVRDLLECRTQGVNVMELATFFEREYRQVALESISPSWMMLGEGFRQGVLRRGMKRLFDLIVSAVLLLLALPIMLIAAVCIVVESGFPVLYRQERVGQEGRVFSIYKFRSMNNNAERDGTPRWAIANDDRTTRVGRIIRKLRIDELPQVINVFKGEMSFVGPRPERSYFVDKLVNQIPYYALRHTVKPGITGWAQVCYSYGASLDDTSEKLQYDLYYLKNHTLFLDLMILIATIEVVLWGKGAR